MIKENLKCEWVLQKYYFDKNQKRQREYAYIYITACKDDWFDSLFGKLNENEEYECPTCHRVVEFNTKKYPNYEYSLGQFYSW